MKKIIVLLAVLACLGISFGIAGTHANNTTAWTDTSLVKVTASTTTYSSKWFNLSNYDYLALVVKCNEQSATGFASDSIKIQYGYQLGYLTVDTTTATGGKKDTLVCPKVILDTLRNDSLGKTSQAISITSTGTASMPSGWLDTTNVAGWATTTKNFFPDWAEIVRFWAKGITGNKAGDSVKVIFEPHRRLGATVTGTN